MRANREESFVVASDPSDLTHCPSGEAPDGTKEFLAEGLTTTPQSASLSSFPSRR